MKIKTFNRLFIMLAIGWTVVTYMVPEPANAEKRYNGRSSTNQGNYQQRERVRVESNDEYVRWLYDRNQNRRQHNDRMRVEQEYLNEYKRENRRR